jgi:hypothetical protein
MLKAHRGPARSLLVALALLAAVTVLRYLLPSGLRAQYFNGPDFAGPPARVTLDDRFTAVDLSRRWGFRPPDAFSVQWSGYLLVPRAGLYSFSVTADDSARLFVDRQAVIEAPGEGPGVRTGQLHLDRGAHAVALQYVQLGGAYSFDWSWAMAGEAPTPIPGWALSPRSRGRLAALVARLARPSSWLLIAVCAALGARLLFRSAFWGARTSASQELGTEGPIPWRTAAVGFGLFAGFAGLQTWPLVTDLAHLSRNDNADTILNEWILAWMAHQLPRDPGRLFSANIFHPEPSSLAFSEPLVVQSLLGAPMFWLGASPVLVYNLVLLAGLALTGWATAVVVMRWTGDQAAALASGLIVAFNAHTLTRLPHLQAQHVWFLPLALLALDALLRRPRWSSALWLALWFVLQALTSIYLLVFTVVALVVAVLVRPEDWSGKAFREVAPKLSVAAVIASLMLAPFLVPYWRLSNAGFERSLDEVAWFSASVKDYWTTPSRLHGWLGTSSNGSTSLFPGGIAITLALLALIWPPRLRDRRLRMCLAFGLVGVVLSFGPIVPGYPLLYFATPLLQAVRASARFGYLGIVAVAVAAGYGLALLRQRLVHRARLRLMATWLLLAGVLMEPFAAPIAYQRFAGLPEIYHRLGDIPNAVVAHLPFPPPEAIFRNAPYMLGSTAHFKPMLNGYSGFTPPSYVEHFLRLADFPSRGALRALRTLGVTHVFVHSERLSVEAIADVTRLPGLELLAIEGTIALYRIQPGDEGF